jgi:glycosyltransferase involved in cell wall biosynthesis
MAQSLRFVSIIIPTFNRCEIIGNTIESCFTQNYPKDKYEIIIADNNSSDNTKKVVTELQSRSPVPLKYIFDPRQGAHHARNTAAKESAGELLYYTDDDMIADENLLTNMTKVFDFDYNVAVVGGRVLPKWEFDPPEWLIKYFNDGTLSLIDKQEKLIIADFDIGIYSCHQMIRKEILFECGGFNPDIAKETLIGNGETGLNIKILNKGYSFGYTSDAVSYHAIPRSRMTQKYINSRYGNQGNCDSFTIFRKKENSKKVLLKLILFSHIPETIDRYFKSVVKMFSGKDSWRVDRAYSHYYFHRILADLKLVTNDEWRSYAVKFNYLDG